jgi:hypothetical protein
MQPYFEALETANYVPDDTPGHGFDGFITVR